MEYDYGYSCNRKTAYLDVDRLCSHGLQIRHTKRQPNSNYYVEQLDFELPELMLLKGCSAVLEIHHEGSVGGTDNYAWEGNQP